MKYIYLPNSYNYSLINEKYSEDEFVDLQVKYRRYLEQFLNNIIDFKVIDKRIKTVLDIPKIDDFEYNFYHKFSSLNSDYLFLRNNYHIENLTDDEVKIIKDNKMDSDFLNKTISKVLFENSDTCFYGNSIPKYEANCKGLVFEFSYDQIQLKEVNEFRIIDQMINEITEFLNTYLGRKLNIPISVITYNGLKDVYKQEEDEMISKIIN